MNHDQAPKPQGQTGDAQKFDYASLRDEALSQWEVEKHAALPNKITTLELPDPKEPGGEILEAGGALVVLQVNAQDMRKNLAEDQEFGQLDPAAAEAAQVQAKDLMTQLLTSLPEDERDTVDVMVFASDGTLATPTGNASPHRRGFETAERVLAGIAETGVDPDNVFNNRSVNGPVGVESLKDLRVLEGIGVPPEEQTDQERNNMKYLEYLKAKYEKPSDTGHGEPFWVHYEIDADEDKAMRLSLGAEGPDEVADRVADTMSQIGRLASGYMQGHAGRRLVVWVDSHYDTISPYVKNNVAELGEFRDRFLGFAKGSGLVFEVPAEEFAKSAEASSSGQDIPAIKAHTNIGASEFDFDLAPGIQRK